LINGSLFPNKVHEINKMIVSSDLLGDTGVVSVPLLFRDGAVVILIREVHQELEEGFILSDLSGDNLRVDLTVVV
jgi:hypothetical protein